MVAFGPLHLPLLNNTFNFRNHRKIIVIDGSVGFIGEKHSILGMKCWDKIKGVGCLAGYTSYHKGEAVRTLQLIFLQDWYYSTNISF